MGLRGYPRELGSLRTTSRPVAALFVAIVLFLGGLTVAVLGAGVFLLRFAKRPPGE